MGNINPQWEAHITKSPDVITAGGCWTVWQAERITRQAANPNALTLTKFGHVMLEGFYQTSMRMGAAMLFPVIHRRPDS